MSIISIVLILLVLGFVIWLVQTAPIPIHPWIKSVIMGVIFIAVLIWILNSLGLNTGVNLRLK
jgi:hypothetical protein